VNEQGEPVGLTAGWQPDADGQEEVDAASALDRVAALQSQPEPDIGAARSSEEEDLLVGFASRLPEDRTSRDAWSRALGLTAKVEAEGCRRRALSALLPRIPVELWNDAFRIAESIADWDERAEAWIAFARAVDDPNLRRTAHERALESIRHATNEDDYPEPLLRLAYDLPDDLLPQALEVACDLRLEQQAADRRAHAFMGLITAFAGWRARSRSAATAAWIAALHRLAERPRAQLMTDLVGFHYLGRVLVGPRREARFLGDVRAVVRDVPNWWT
jgi:hypothetical protein